MVVSNIVWDTEEDYNLPKEVRVDSNMTVDDICEYLSNKYGFCVISFEVN